MKKHGSITSAFLTVFFLIFTVSGAGSELSGREEKKPEEKKETAEKKKSEEKELFYKMTVTATGTKKDTFDIPKAVSVVTDREIREKAPNNVSDLLIQMPGVDVNGVGSNQSRPMIRGMRGQRILLMEDGIRMNNSRRQQDFGEIPALVDISEVERVEVVRGPASVLYGSDAIGGVINIITRVPEFDYTKNEFGGTVGHKYSSYDSQNKVNLSLNGNMKRFGFMISGNYRQTDEYMAPAGSFGNITLDNETPVLGTGIRDGGLNVLFLYKLKDSINLSLKYEYYKAVDAGFGYVDPADYAPGDPVIKIDYPLQEVEKYSFKYEHNNMDFFLADRISFVAYSKGNQRELTNDILIPFGIPGMPAAGINILSENYTDISTVGFRMEMNKSVKSHLFTYGVDYFADTTRNSDKLTSQMVGFAPFPLYPSTTTVPNVPNASFRSMGVFVQDDILLFNRASLIMGVRYQNVNAKTRETPGLEGQPVYDSTDDTVVGSVNFMYGILDNLKLVVSVGRGFRSPNLIERFYDGATPEGSAYQSRNTDLKAETSLNFDLGMKFRSDIHFLEFTYFNNTIYDGIRISPTGNEVMEMPEYQNVNIDKLRMKGFELAGGVYTSLGVTVGFNYTKLSYDDLGIEELSSADTFNSKFNFYIRYDHPSEFFWASYDLRITGDQKDVQIGDNPIGDFLPGFTVHNASIGIKLFKGSDHPLRVSLMMGNITNALYSEISNATFFRPAPKRYVALNWSMDF